MKLINPRLKNLPHQLGCAIVSSGMSFCIKDALLLCGDGVAACSKRVGIFLFRHGYSLYIWNLFPII